MVGNGDEPSVLRMQEMDMAAGLPYRFESKSCEDFYYLKS
jgi:hypothetical protein